MDIYEYIESVDVRNYCKKKGRHFTPIEMAVIIEESGKDKWQKIEAFQELIDTYPDMQFHESVRFQRRSSLHDYLRALIYHYRNPMEKNPGYLGRIYVEIPSPFEVGDIVCSCYAPDSPCVIHQIPKGKKIPYVSGEQMKDSDGIGAYVHDLASGFVRCAGGRDDEFGWSAGGYIPISSVQYYRKELTGQNRFLVYLKDYIKKYGETKELQWLGDYTKALMIIKKTEEELVKKDNAYCELVEAWHSSREAK